MIWFREWKYNIIFHPLQCSFIKIWFYNLQCGICLQWTVFTLYFPSTLSSIWLKLNNLQGRKKTESPSYFYNLYQCLPSNHHPPTTYINYLEAHCSGIESFFKNLKSVCKKYRVCLSGSAVTCRVRACTRNISKFCFYGN